jgi:ERCC4-type nuclease
VILLRHPDLRLIASVERKSLTDLVASLTSGRLRYALAELAALPRAAVAVEDRWRTAHLDADGELSDS